VLYAGYYTATRIQGNIFIRRQLNGQPELVPRRWTSVASTMVGRINFDIRKSAHPQVNTFITDQEKGALTHAHHISVGVSSGASLHPR
jgi:hypothetical protein